MHTVGVKGLIKDRKDSFLITHSCFRIVGIVSSPSSSFPLCCSNSKTLDKAPFVIAFRRTSRVKSDLFNVGWYELLALFSVSFTAALSCCEGDV